MAEVATAVHLSGHLRPCLTASHLLYRAAVRRHWVCKASRPYHVHIVGVPSIPVITTTDRLTPKPHPAPGESESQMLSQPA